MSAGQYDILIEQGATFEETLSIQDAGGVPVNLTGASARAQVRKRYSDTVVIASFTCTIPAPATGGLISVKMTATETALIPVLSAQGHLKTSTDYVYDLELVEANGTVIRLIEGTCSVSPEVTR